ncbi:patatin-like protein [Azotobacter sp. CWF10]
MGRFWRDRRPSQPLRPGLQGGGWAYSPCRPQSAFAFCVILKRSESRGRCGAIGSDGPGKTDDERERAPAGGRPVRRRIARDLPARHQSGNPQSGSGLEALSWRQSQRGSGKPPRRLHETYPDEPENSTGDVYLDFLEALGKDVCLRVIVDVIAGSSAGGINGVTLATALAHDLSLIPVTRMWLEEADMLSLLAPEAKARLWSKWYFWPLMRPLLTRLDREGLLPGKADAEIAKRISVFLRSRWFKPPLDGRRLTTLILDALTAMKTSSSPWESLLPQGARLDLLVTVTDFRGIERPIFIHDPPVAYEREHRHLLRFGLDHRKTGHLLSDFDVDNFPSLAFAGRATASFPGAFPPARIREIDEILAERHIPWPARAHFLERNFRHYRERGENPEEAVLLDGSVLDNKPIMACVEAIRTHCAFREVDRRLVFIDPHPGIGKAAPGAGVPGFFATLRGALSDLPRHDPVYNELAVISRYNVQARRLKTAISSARPLVAKLIGQATAGGLRGASRPTTCGTGGFRRSACWPAPRSSMTCGCARWFSRPWTTSCRSSPVPVSSPPTRRKRVESRTSSRAGQDNRGSLPIPTSCRTISTTTSSCRLTGR